MRLSFRPRATELVSSRGRAGARVCQTQLLCTGEGSEGIPPPRPVAPCSGTAKDLESRGRGPSEALFQYNRVRCSCRRPGNLGDLSKATAAIGPSTFLFLLQDMEAELMPQDPKAGMGASGVGTTQIGA